MTEKLSLPFDHVKAHEHITRADKRMARVIAKTGEFRFQLDQCDSVYESLLEAIAYQSISGKAAATIFARIKALGSNGLCPTPAEILAVSNQKLREAGLSGAKAAAMKDLAQKTIDGVVPTLEAAGQLSDEELVERLISVRGIGAWTVEMFLIFRLPPRRTAHPRLRRAKRFRAHLRQKSSSQAARTRRLRRTLAPLPHRRQLVHVARRRTLRQDAQAYEKHKSEEARQAAEEIKQEGRRKEALRKEENIAKKKAFIGRGAPRPS